MPSRIHETKSGFPGSSFRYTPVRHVRVLFISFVQGLFAEAPTGNYRWSPDEETTEIIIRNENVIHASRVGQRPAINFTMGPMQLYSLGIDDMFTQDFDLARKVKIVNVPGTMNINCCSRVDLEAHDLAWVVSEHVWLLRELLIKAGFYETGRNIEIGPPSAAGSIVAQDSGDEWYCAPVRVPFQFSRKSAFTALGQKIARNIELTVNEQVSHLVDEGRGGPALAEANYPVVVHEAFPPPFTQASDVYGKTPDPAGTRTYALPVVPHPLNPAKLVTVRTVRPNAARASRIIR